MRKPTESQVRAALGALREVRRGPLPETEDAASMLAAMVDRASRRISETGRRVIIRAVARSVEEIPTTVDATLAVIDRALVQLEAMAEFAMRRKAA